MACYQQKLIGALTSKPFAFTARSWEVVMVPSVDPYDSFLGSLRLDFRNNDLLRILPLINEGLNEEWLTDKARFSYDGLKRQRFLKPYTRIFGPYADSEHAEAYFKCLVELRKASTIRAVSEERFLSVFSTALEAVGPRGATVFFGKEVDLETALAARLFLEGRFNQVIYRNGDYSNLSELNPDLLKFAINPEMLLAAPALLLLGSNLRWELPLFNIKIMRRALAGVTSVFTVAIRSVFSYPVVNLSANASEFVSRVVRGRSRVLTKVPNLFVVLSYNLVSFASSLSLVSKFNVGVVFPWASTVSLLEASPAKAAQVSKGSSLALSVNSDALDLSDHSLSLGLLSHGHSAHSNLDFILPCSAYSESNSHFFNVFRNERYARFGYALSKNILPTWGSLVKLFRPRIDSLVTLTVSLNRGYFSSTVSKPFENEQLDYSSYYTGSFFTPFFTRLTNSLFYEVTPNYYRTHYVSRGSKPTSLAAARFSFGLSNFIRK